MHAPANVLPQPHILYLCHPGHRAGKLKSHKYAQLNDMNYIYIYISGMCHTVIWDVHYGKLRVKYDRILKQMSFLSLTFCTCAILVIGLESSNHTNTHN